MDDSLPPIVSVQGHPLCNWLLIFYRYPVYSFFLPIYSFWRMDEFGWGNTRIVLDDGRGKRVMANPGEMRFKESMIPYMKFSGKYSGCRVSTFFDRFTEYETETLGNKGSDSHSAVPVSPSPQLPAPQPRRPVSQLNSAAEFGQFDHYRDTHAMSRPGSQVPADPNQSHASLRQSMFRGVQQERASVASMNHSRMASPLDPRMTMMSSLNRPISPAISLGAYGMRPMSTFSAATTAFNAPSNNLNPSDEELYSALRAYLSSKDLMSVTKKCV